MPEVRETMGDWTKGPWDARPAEDSSCEWEIIKGPIKPSGDPWFIALCMDDADGASSEANANLIAAAPDGAEFAAEFIAYIEGSDLNDLDFGRGLAGSGLIEKARTFLSRARGEGHV